MNNGQTTTIANGRSTRSWPKRYTLLGLCFCAAFVCYIDRVNISVAAIAMQDSFGWSETTKGFVLSSFFIGYMLFQVPAGYLASRYGGKIVLGIAVIWWSVFTLLTPLAASLSLPVLIAVRIVMGLGEAAMFPAAVALFSKWVPATERSRAISALVSGIPIGTMFALATTGWIVAQYGWPSVFYLFGAVGILWALAWFFKTYESPEVHPAISSQELALLTENSIEQGSAAKTIPWKRLFSQPAIWALIVNHFCTNWGLYILLAWLPSYFNKMQGLSTEYAGLFAALPWLIMVIMVNVAAWIADWMTRRGLTLTVVRKTMQTVGLLGSALFLLLAAGSSSTAASVLLMCGALGTLAFTWSGFACNHLDIAPRYAGLLMGITNTAGTLPGIIGVIITGWLLDLTGTYTAAFLLTAGINVFGVVIWLCFSTGKRVID